MQGIQWATLRIQSLIISLEHLEVKAAEAKAVAVAVVAVKAVVVAKAAAVAAEEVAAVADASSTEGTYPFITFIGKNLVTHNLKDEEISNVKL
jgi:hypothetical protein